MRRTLERARGLAFAAGALALLTADAPAEGSRTLGFVESHTGPIDVVTAEADPGSWTWNPANGSYVGSITLTGVPPGATVLRTYFYYTSWYEKTHWKFGPNLTWVEFDGAPVTIYETGRHVSYLGRYFLLRAPIANIQDGTYSLEFGVRGSSWWIPDAAGLLVVYEDPAISDEYTILIADGANAVVHVSRKDNGPSPNPTTLQNFVVGADAAPEVEIFNMARGLTSTRSGWYTLDGVVYGSWKFIGANMFGWGRWDLSPHFTGGETQAVLNVGEGTQARIVWCVTALRVRTGPLVTDTTPPEIAVVLPGDGEVLATTPTTVRVTVLDESGTAITSVPPLAWNPSTLPPVSEDYSEADFDLVEGPNSLSVTATDDFGLWSTDSVTILLDTIVPTVTIADPPGGFVFGASPVDLTFTVDDATTALVDVPAAGVLDLVVPPALPGDPTPVITVQAALTEGPNDLTVTATDEAGRTGGDSVGVILDTIPPVVTVSTPFEGAVLGDTPGSFSIDVVDATATTVAFGAHSVSLGPGGGTASGDVELLEGSNAIAVVVTDEAGNETTVLRSLILDLTAPVVTIDDPEDGDVFGPGEESIFVQATVDDLTETTVSSSPAGLAATLPAGGGVATGSVDLGEGQNIVTVFATDEVPRTGSASIAVILDTTPPDVAVVAPEDGDAVRGPVDFAATAVDVLPGSGIAQVDFLVDGLVVETLATGPYETSYDTASLTDGWHAFAATGHDGVGNAATSTVMVLVDNTEPTVQILEPADAAVVGGVIDFGASAADAIAGLVSVQMFVGAGRPNVVDDSATFDPPESSTYRLSREDTTPPWHLDGSLTLTAEARDAAGNSATATVKVEVDNTAPAKTILAPSDGDVVSGVLQILTAAEDPNLASIEILVDGVSQGTSATSPYAVDYDTRERLDGALVVTVIATDVVGNASSCSVTVTVDNVAVALSPASLNLKSKGKATSVTAHLEGENLALLLPTEAAAIEIHVPGGNPVPATADWAGDDALSDSDGDGIPELTVKFDRQLLIAAVKAALAGGYAGSDSRVDCTMRAGGGFVIGTDSLKIVGK